MFKRVLLPASLTFLLTSCEPGHVISAKSFELGSTPVRISMDATGQSVGPTRELCLGLSPEDADSVELSSRRSGAHHSPIHVVLITEHGIPDTLGGQLGAAVLRRDASTICLWDQGLAAPYGHRHALDSLRTIPAHPGPSGGDKYTAVELSAERPIQVKQVRWWSGQRSGFP